MTPEKGTASSAVGSNAGDGSVVTTTRASETSKSSSINRGIVCVQGGRTGRCSQQGSGGRGV